MCEGTEEGVVSPARRSMLLYEEMSLLTFSACKMTERGQLLVNAENLHDPRTGRGRFQPIGSCRP